ncbi:FAD:protein FMN transferase [Kordiimonas pumila]|uniref:FAD:protein FMN transferase n=1 Tax=Kordiimonas pumila TaxID=2161677 RepID=A0ABV7D0C9_9PROT|nr:FAD:protein FMN transferase [Kordiimonas pumila]
MGRIAQVVVVGKSRECLDRAVRTAFEAASSLEAIISRDSANSELMALCSSGFGRYIPVSADLRAMLLLANDIAYHTDGIFDVAAASTCGNAHWTDIDLSRAGHVLLRKRLSLSFGGFIKGYAADVMVRSLMESGVGAGLVDIGGCIKAYGGSEWRIEFAQSSSPQLAGLCSDIEPAIIPIPLIDSAIAGFGPYFGMSKLVDLQQGLVVSPEEWGNQNIVIRATSCAVADALTKVLALEPAYGEQLLRLFGAATAIFPVPENKIEKQFYKS